MSITVLVDGDGFAYRAAMTAERAIDWGDGLWTLHADANDAIRRMDDDIMRCVERIDPNAKIEMAITDSGANFRNSVWPTYKAKRKKTRKPVCLPAMREHLLTHWNARLRPNLEGDDVLGILATHPTIVPGEKVILSADKDFFTIPGKFCRTAGEDAFKIVDVSQEEADIFHLKQTLMGDTTDEYPGCPGVGPVKAEKIISEVLEGLPPGADVVAALWPVIVGLFTKAKQNEAAALVQARCARILRHTDYDFNAKEPILWTPPKTP